MENRQYRLMHAPLTKEVHDLVDMQKKASRFLTKRLPLDHRWMALLS